LFNQSEKFAQNPSIAESEPEFKDFFKIRNGREITWNIKKSEFHSIPKFVAEVSVTHNSENV
jgi:hypothetical protein